MRKIISLLVLLAINSCLFSQSHTTYEDMSSVTNSIDLSKIKYGFKISPTISWLDITDNDLQAEGATTKLSVGAVAEYPISSFLSFVSGVNYSQLGGYASDNYSQNETAIKDYYKISYSEIEIPILLKIQTKSIYNTSYFLQGGVSASFINGSSEKYYPIANKDKPYFENIDQYTSPSRTSYQFGAGISYSIGTSSSIFGLISYKNSFTNIANSTNYESRTYLDASLVEKKRFQETTPVTPVQIFPGCMEFSFGLMF